MTKFKFDVRIKEGYYSAIYFFKNPKNYFNFVENSW